MPNKKLLKKLLIGGAIGLGVGIYVYFCIYYLHGYLNQQQHSNKLLVLFYVPALFLFMGSVPLMDKFIVLLHLPPSLSIFIFFIFWLLVGALATLIISILVKGVIKIHKALSRIGPNLKFK